MLFLLSHRGKKDQTRRCPGCGSAGVPGEPAGWAALLPHRQLLLHRDHQVTEWPSQQTPAQSSPATAAASCLLSSLLLPTSFTHRVSRPTGGIRNSKFSKQFQYFQYICWDFITVHGQKRFSTSHTQTLVRFLFLASLYFVGPTQTATLRCSAQPYHGRTPHPCRYHG